MNLYKVEYYPPNSNAPDATLLYVEALDEKTAMTGAYPDAKIETIICEYICSVNEIIKL